MYAGSIRFFAVKSLKMTFSNFFGTFCHEKKLFQQVFRFDYLRAIFLYENSIVLTDENPLLQSLFWCC